MTRGRILRHRPDAQRATGSEDELAVEESHRMARELGQWLVETTRRLRNHRDRRGGGAGSSGTPAPSFWRGLVAIWCTSPQARSRYSDHARRGLLAALDDMDDRTAMDLIARLLETSTAQAPPLAAA
jgi:hypothetical protein